MDSTEGVAGGVACTDAHDAAGTPIGKRDGLVAGRTMPGGVVGAILGAGAAAPLGWLSADSVANLWPDAQRGAEQQIVFSLVAMLAAGSAGALLAGFAIRHPMLVIPEIALITQAFGIVLLLVAMGMESGPSFGYLILALVGPIGAATEVPYVVLGSIAFGILFRFVGQRFVSERDAEVMRNRDAHDGTRLAWTIALTVVWYVAGPVILFSLYPYSPGY